MIDTTTADLAASMDDAAARVIATDRAILALGVSEIARRYSCSPDVARAALLRARAAQDARVGAAWRAVTERQRAEWTEIELDALGSIWR